MQTPQFWRALDRLGTDGASQLHWRRELEGAFDAAKPYLRRLPGIAGHVPDPDDRRSRLTLTVHPTDGDGYVAVSEESPAHRAPLELSAEDVALLAPDWEALRPALAELLGFTPLSTTVQHSGVIRQLGISQPEIERTIPVFLYLPHGSFSDPHILLSSLHQLPEGVLYVPTRRHLVAAVFAVTKPRNITVESIADRISRQPNPATTTLTVTATYTTAAPARKKAGPILAAQPGRTWDKLVIRLTEKGTLIARYGGHTGEHRFGRKVGADGQAKYPEMFLMLLKTCVDNRWENPPRTHKTYGAKQRAFARLGELLKKLTLIEGEPFHKIQGGWEPKFQFEPDAALSKAIDLHRRGLAEQRANPSRGGRRYDDEDEDQ